MTDAVRSFEVSVSPEVLRWARETAGVSVEWAAHRAGRLPEEVAQWEEGRARPTFAALKTIAALYQRPVSVLLLNEPPHDQEIPQDRRSFAGVTVEPLGRASRLAIREAHRLRGVTYEIHDEFGIRTQLPVGSARVKDAVVDLATEERKRLGIEVRQQEQWSSDGEAWSNWRAAVENLNVLVLQFNMPVRELRGFSLSAGVEPPTIVVSGRDRLRPRIFTLFHEYAHLLLGAGAICLPAPYKTRSRTIEGFCNAFAGALLVPRDELIRDKTSHRLGSAESFPDTALRPLTSRFKVTRYVVLERLYKEGVIKKSAYRRKWLQWTRDFDEWKEQEGGSPTPPHERALASRGLGLTSLLLEAADRSVIHYEDVTDYLGIRSKHLETLAMVMAQRTGAG